MLRDVGFGDLYIMYSPQRLRSMTATVQAESPHRSSSVLTVKGHLWGLINAEESSAQRAKHRLEKNIKALSRGKNNQLCDISDHVQMVMQHNEESDILACKPEQTEAHPALFFFFFSHKHASWVILCMLRVLTV